MNYIFRVNSFFLFNTVNWQLYKLDISDITLLKQCQTTLDNVTGEHDDKMVDSEEHD